MRIGDLCESESTVITDAQSLRSCSTVRDSCSTTVSNSLRQEFDRLLAVIDGNATDEGLMKAAKKYSDQLSKLKTPAQIYSFFNEESSVGLHRRRKIRVQPTSISRRKLGVSHGSARQRAGRPLQVVDGTRRRALKRRRCLNDAVRENRPNAKSHGDAH
jgi:hypothetical protein